MVASCIIISNNVIFCRHYFFLFLFLAVLVDVHDIGLRQLHHREGVRLDTWCLGLAPSSVAPLPTLGVAPAVSLGVLLTECVERPCALLALLPSRL